MARHRYDVRGMNTRMAMLRELDDAGRGQTATRAPYEAPLRSSAARGLRLFGAGLVVLDSILLVAATMAASVFRFGLAKPGIAGDWRGASLAGVPYTVVGLAFTVGWVCVLAFRGGYSRRRFGS